MSWSEIESEAAGSTVYWNAWGGDQRVNNYIRWVAKQVEKQYQINVVHVKLNDTAEAVSRILAEKAAGREQGGSVDLIWINGENFADLKANNMLYGPVSELLPNYQHIDRSKAALFEDFTIPVDGLQVPWGLSVLVWLVDTQQVANTPQNVAELLTWAEQNPGRFSYPAPPDFVGTSFLKQLLIEFTADKTPLYQAVNAETEVLIEPVFDYLDRLIPHMWRQGRTLPNSGLALKQLLADGEVDFSLSFNPADGISSIQSGLLSESVHTYLMQTGGLSNAHFVAIPQNANAKAAAMVLANFLLSAEAQAHKADIDIWGDTPVIDVSLLDDNAANIFANLAANKRMLDPTKFSNTLAEPHPSWIVLLEKAWLERYGQ